MEFKTKIPEAQYSLCDFKITDWTLQKVLVNLKTAKQELGKLKHRENMDRVKRTESQRPVAQYQYVQLECKKAVRENLWQKNFKEMMAKYFPNFSKFQMHQTKFNKTQDYTYRKNIYTQVNYIQIAKNYR